jgi:hypothetical protein
MRILDSLKSIFAPQGGGSNAMAMWLYVRCKRCGSPLAVRVDLRNEPSPDYENGGYVLRKEMMDDKCFTLMRAEVHFDDRRQVTQKQVENGEFISREEYGTLTQ